MRRKIVPLVQEEWRGYELLFRYETTHYYDVDIQSDADGTCVSFAKKPFPTPIMKEFRDTLFPDHWEGAEAFGVFEGDCLIACLEIWKEDWSNRLRVTELWVDEKFRRQGIGKRLMDVAKERAKEEGCRAIVLETQSCNENAIAFYCSQGFILFGFDQSCYGNHDIENKEVRVEFGWWVTEETR